MKTVLVLGGDGFCGWPTALHLSAKGYDVTIVDNLSRREIDKQLGIDSLTPIQSIEARIAAWREVSGREVGFSNIDIAKQPAELTACLDTIRPDVIVHFAEQRAAPYSMRGAKEKRYTVDNNVSGTHNLLVAMVELQLDAHLIHLGTMGVYGYSGDGFSIPEGYLPVEVQDDNGVRHSREILFPTSPGSVYHLTKSLDQLFFQFYAKNDGIRITDLHQGIVWGTQTDETRMDERLINRFDYDGEYGTVLNRFLVQAATGHPLTVHGTGGQTRAFINIQDTVRCVALAAENAPERGDGVTIINQVAETLRLSDLAGLVAQVTGAEITHVANPRAEAAENELVVSNATFRALGLDPMLLETDLIGETIEISGRYRARVDLAAIPATSAWNDSRRREIAAA
ncbi:NAD-dependent epimerase/dehydratase family protein [Altererythrobacter sp. ZODW24]|uniref:NAD-dependent epimerase/dehydratase family protein n=1 Tax=Altererythrobacter sp. ZODW24 TaxID=2185142 RepID=UPI000DF7D8C6|nr:NAD-dependent epimerase/dehydratase family protein [Altererythrobacter sp. ZODW24]